jgi:hypothetical protein
VWAAYIYASGFWVALAYASKRDDERATHAHEPVPSDEEGGESNITIIQKGEITDRGGMHKNNTDDDDAKTNVTAETATSASTIDDTPGGYDDFPTLEMSTRNAPGSLENEIGIFL